MFRSGISRAYAGFDNRTSISIYSDSKWDMGSTDRKSYSDFVLDLYDDMVHWLTHQQPAIAAS